MGTQSIANAINETCTAIWILLKPEVMPKPKRQDWERIEEGFRKRWHFPNCIGSVDGKHISIQKPSNTGSLYYNYKGYFSIVLLAVVDAYYKFITVDIGQYGSNCDSNVFRSSTFGRKYINYGVDGPPEKRLPNYDQEGPMPHVLVGDEAFPCLHNLMRPYPRYLNDRTLPHDESIFNYRLCRARMTVECAFGILAQRFRIFSRRIPLSETNADKIIQAACCLHNYLTEEKAVEQIYEDLNPNREPFLDEAGVACLYLPRLQGYRTSEDAQGVRDIFKAYFNSPQGRVSWQENRITYSRSN